MGQDTVGPGHKGGHLWVSCGCSLICRRRTGKCPLGQISWGSLVTLTAARSEVGRWRGMERGQTCAPLSGKKRVTWDIQERGYL